jgi:hypothetical protein
MEAWSGNGTRPKHLKRKRRGFPRGRPCDVYSPTGVANALLGRARRIHMKLAACLTLIVGALLLLPACQDDDPVQAVPDTNILSDECRQFVDDHWSEEQWTLALARGDLEPFFPEYGPGTTPADVPLYFSFDGDPTRWYRNALTWDVFAWGWREFWDDAWNKEVHPILVGEAFYDPQPGLREFWFFDDNALATPLREEIRLICAVEIP